MVRCVGFFTIRKMNDHYGTCLKSKLMLCIHTLFRFIEGDFDSYVSQIRKTHVWGGEPELLMASHVLK